MRTTLSKLRAGTELALAYPGAELTAEDCRRILDFVDLGERCISWDPHPNDHTNVWVWFRPHMAPELYAGLKRLKEEHD